MYENSGPDFTTFDDVADPDHAGDFWRGKSLDDLDPLQLLLRQPNGWRLVVIDAALADGWHCRGRA